MSLSVKKKKLFTRQKDLAQQNLKRERRKKVMRRSALSLLVMIVLSIGGGLAYTWYVGQYKTVALQEAPKHKKRVEFKKPKVASNVRIGAAVQSITSPVEPGSNAAITVRSNPLVNCTIDVKYNEVKSKDSGLTKKTADDFGMVSWSWTVEPSVPLGKWPVTVLCANKKYSAMVKADLVVKAAVTE